MLTEQNESINTTIVIGTVKGDPHYIGKNLLAKELIEADFKVVDLGIDVSADMFVNAVKESGANMVGIFGLLIPNLEYMKNIIIELDTAGLRSKVRVLVWGSTISETFASKIGADAYAKKAETGLEICKAWAQETPSMVSRALTLFKGGDYDEFPPGKYSPKRGDVEVK
jgi:5-methyltetrahydrofolate--homocysteine methyltransferase